MLNQIEKSTDTISTHVIGPGSAGSLYRDGPFSLVADEVISLVTPGGSDVMRWIPTRTINHQFTNIAHLSWMGPSAMNGSVSYGDYLAGLTPVEICDFQDQTSTWQTCEYRTEGARITANSDTVNLEGLNYRMFEQQPTLTVRGDNVGMALGSDWEWALARAGIDLANHLDWNLWYGDVASFTNTSNGIDRTIRTGFVRANKVGPGACDFTDPVVYTGVGKSVKDVVNQIRTMFRKIYDRAEQRNYKLTPNDIAVVMSRSHWSVIADYLAANGTLFSSDDKVVLNTSIRELRAERRDLTTRNGLYAGFIPLPEFDIPVIVDNYLGKNTTFGVDSRPGVIGDIFMLTRRFAGMTILEQQYQDYNELLRVQNLPVSPNRFTQQNGIILATYLMKNNICFSYGAEVKNRFVSTMQHLQGRINDVLFETLASNEIEGASFTHPNWYAYQGQQSGTGTALIVGLK